MSIYHQKGAIRFRLILEALATVKSEMKGGYTPRNIKKDDLVDFAQELGFDEFQTIKRFVTLLQVALGEVGKNNPFSTKTGFIPLFDIYYNNLLDAKDELVIERMKCIVGKSDVMMYMGMMGRESQHAVRNAMLNYMNKGRTVNKLI